MPYHTKDDFRESRLTVEPTFGNPENQIIAGKRELTVLKVAKELVIAITETNYCINRLKITNLRFFIILEVYLNNSFYYFACLPRPMVDKMANFGLS